MKRIALLLIGIMVFGFVGGVVSSTQVATAQQQLPSSACDLMNDPNWDDLYDERGVVSLSGLTFNAGETVYITAGDHDGAEVVPENIFYRLDSSTVASGPYPGSMTWTAPADMTVFSIEITTDGLAWIPWTASCSPGGTVTGAGCDVYMDIPETAVVGAFVSDAALYYEPGNLIWPYTEIEADNTAWVIGKDASGMYYKVLWVCQFVWVPIDTMGPNYDDVWMGKSLPTEIVE